MGSVQLVIMPSAAQVPECLPKVLVSVFKSAHNQAPSHGQEEGESVCNVGGTRFVETCIAVTVAMHVGSSSGYRLGIRTVTGWALLNKVT